VIVQSASAYTATSLSASATPQRQTAAHATAASTAASANSADTVVISQVAKELFAAQSSSAATSASGATARYDTSQGALNLDIDAYFTPGANAGSAASSVQSLPPLLLPTQSNVDALRSHISAAMPQFLARNGIPAAPASVTYDSNGQLQLPADYADAAKFKEALANDPALARELSTVNALASHVAEMKKLIPFQEEYAAATSQAAADAVVAKYSYLFSANHHYASIALQFSAGGELSLTADGKPLS